MRLRVQTLPPLPDLKAWFIPDDPQVPNSILELKELLCSEIRALRDAGLTRSDIQLVLDDFELLSESPFAAALRDGDLVHIRSPLDPKVLQKRTATNDTRARSSQKRKREAEGYKPSKKARKSKKRGVVGLGDGNESDSSSSSSRSSSSSSNSSSSSTSSSSSSSSSSSTSSSSSSSSNSDHTKSSRSSSAPPLQSSKIVAKKPASPSTPRNIYPVTSSANNAAKIPPEGPFVPPGEGKATTHARNLRRKRMRAAEAETRALIALQEVQGAHGHASIPRGISNANVVPLGDRGEPQRPAEKGERKENTALTREERGEVMMASLGNKNKKKGYKQFLKAPVPKKIVFAEEGVMTSSSTLALQELPPAANTQPHQLQSERQLPRLVPPSEIQERGQLPPNVFVTSVDVEADLWNSNGKKTKKKRNAKDLQSSYYQDDLYDPSHGDVGEENIVLPYGDLQNENYAEGMRGYTQSVSAALNHNTESAASFDWNMAEKTWDTSSKVIRQDLKKGDIVGWKSLDIHPQTFTPEILLIAARVVAFPSAETVEVQRLLRPVDPHFGFSGFCAPASTDEGEVETELYQWDHIQSSDWRLLHPTVGSHYTGSGMSL